MESVNSNFFQSHCTWKPTEGKNISEAIAWSDRNENSDIEETIQAENCVLLETPTEVEAGQPPTECRLMLYSQPPYLIQKVTVLCEARLTEIYGRHAEYLKTIRNQIVDEVDDMVVFRGDVQLERPSPECSLKFTGLKVKTSMWLYGVTVKVAPVQANTTPVSTLFSPNLGPTNNMAGGMDRNRNNAQFMSLMSSMFGPQIDSRPQQVAPPIVATPPAPTTPQPDVMGLLMSLMQANQSPLASTQPGLTSPMQQQSVMTLINQIAQQQIAQHYPVPNLTPSNNTQNGPLPTATAQTMPINSQPVLNGSSSSANQASPVNDTVNISEDTLQSESIDTLTSVDNQPKEILKDDVPEVQVEAKEKVEEKRVETPVEVASPPAELTIEKQTTSTTNLQPTGLSKSVGATPSREAAFELPPEVVDQITDSVVNNIECGLENMEQRLWGKIVNRLQEMETRILARMEEVIDVLQEVEDGIDERETPEREDENALRDDEEEEEDLDEEETDSVLKV